ncbi:hypothetical protein LguiA_031562 [Lonicera macranthoides]
MSVIGRLVAKISIKSSGDVFHELFRDDPHYISKITPVKLQGCRLLEGQFGKAGSVIQWNYFHDGKARVAKQVIQAIDAEKKSITYKQFEGDLMELYKSFLISIHVDTNGEDNLVTWTLDYEKLNENIPYPTTLMDYFVQVTKDIETHHLK